MPICREVSIISLAAVLLLSRHVTRKDATAFGPWMVAGAAVGALWPPALTL